MGRPLYFGSIAAIVVIGAWLRLFDLDGPSLWLDEMLHLEVTRSLVEAPWPSFLIGVREVDEGTENGSLYFLFQMLGQRLAPGDLGVRLLPALIGTLSLPLMASAGRLLGGRAVALVATFLLAVSPLHVYFSREGRPYYLLMTLSLLLLWVLLRNRSGNGVIAAWLGCLLGAYVGIQSLSILLSFLALAVIGLWAGRHSEPCPGRSAYLHSSVAATLALALAFGLYMTHSQTNAPSLERTEAQIEFLESPVFESPFNTKTAKRFVASMTTSGHPSIGMRRRSWILLGIALIGCLAGLRRTRQTEPDSREGSSPAVDRLGVLFATGMFLLPAGLSFAALAALARWYEIRYTSAAQPAFLLLVALGIVTIGRFGARGLSRGQSPRLTAGLTAATSAALLVAFVAPNVAEARDAPYRKLDWRGVAGFFDSVALEGEPVVVPNDWPQICLDHYLQQLGREVEFVKIWERADLGEKVVAERDRGWLLTAGYRKSNEARTWMHRFTPVLKRKQEEMALFFFPDLVTLLETRFAAGKGGSFVNRFQEMGHRFDFGGGELMLQGSGWSYAEDDGAGTDFQWAVGSQAELGIPIAEPRNARIWLRARPLSYPGAPRQQVELWLNESLIGELELQDGWSEHEVPALATAWSTGSNVLSLRFASSALPIRVIEGAKDRRPLSLAFDSLEILF